MDTSTQARLRRINRDFYSSRAADFDRTRHPGGWPGWRRVVETAMVQTPAAGARPPLRVLDLGCGNGRFALFLERNPEFAGHRLFGYDGIDLSEELIEHARSACAGRRHIRFQIDDIENCLLHDATYDLVALFGVLHHLPGFDSRRRALQRAASTVAPGGLLAVTCWQFTGDPRFKGRQLDWSEEPAVDREQLEPGDHLLRWGPADSGARRYCHEINEQEVDRLVDGLPLVELSRYRADGPGDRQNLYWLGARRLRRDRVRDEGSRPRPGTPTPTG